MVPSVSSALVSLLIFGDLAFDPLEKPPPQPTFELVAYGADAPPPVSLTVNRPDGTVWRQTWTALKPEVPVDMAGWHVGPGRYRITLETDLAAKTFEQILARPVLKSRMHLYWEGTPPPAGVVPPDAFTAAREGHRYLRSVYLTTVQQPHPGVGIDVDPDSSVSRGLHWVATNHAPEPIVGAGPGDILHVRIDRLDDIDRLTTWGPEAVYSPCASPLLLSPQVIEPGGPPVEWWQSHPPRSGTFEPGLHRFVFDYGLVSDPTPPQPDVLYPMITVRTVHRHEAWFRLSPF